MEYEKQVKALRCCATGECDGCQYYKEYGYRCAPMVCTDSATAIEELMAQVKDKDYLIQQQAEEIERLRRDVKKQQEKMIELAKKLPKRGEWIDDGPHIRCSVCGFSCDDEYYLAEKRYCPNCGAKMEVQDADT